MSNKTIIKAYRKENVCIKITDFELRDVSFYGCDAIFYFDIYDKETQVLLDTDCEIVENAFMGGDDSEFLWEFLEEKGIDFSEEYDDDFDKLPADLRKEFADYELSFYDDAYHEWFFGDAPSSHEDIINKIMNQLCLDRDKLYVVKGNILRWITVTSDYFGIHLHSDKVKIESVYNVQMQDWIYEVEGCYFYVTSDLDLIPHYSLVLCKRDEQHPYTVTTDDFKNDIYPGYHGKVGDVIYDYEECF